MTMQLASTPANIAWQPRHPEWRGLLLLVTCVVAVPLVVNAQGAPGVAPAHETPTSIARLLAGRKAFAELTVKGKVRRDIKMDDEVYPIAEGPSRVLLLKLPDYHEPYALTIAELPVQALVLDGVWHLRSHHRGARRRLRGDSDRARSDTAGAKSASMMKGARLQARLFLHRVAEGRALRAALYESPLCRPGHTEGGPGAQCS